MQNFSNNVKVIAEICQKVGPSARRDFGEIENLQYSVNGAQRFTDSAERRLTEYLLYMFQKMRPKYSIQIDGKKIHQGSDIAHTVVIQTMSGKKSFGHALSGTTVLIGIEEQKKMIVGVIYDLITDDVFVAEQGKGAFLYHAYRARRLRVSKRKNEKTLLYGTNDMNYMDAKVMTHYHDRHAEFILGVCGGKYDSFTATNLTEAEKIIGGLFIVEAGGFMREEKDALIFESGALK